MLSKLQARLLLPLYERWQGYHIQSMIPEIQLLLKKSCEELKANQLNRLKNLLFHASATVPYYSRVLKELGFHPEDLKSIDDLKSLPLLTKDKIREYSSELLSKTFSTNDLDRSSTGGTTDVPITYYRNKGCTQERWAVTWAFNHWYGWENDSRIAYLWGASIDLNRRPWKYGVLNKVLYDRIVFPSSVMNDKILGQYVAKIKSFNPDIIQAYPSAMEILARFALERGERLPRPKAIIVTAEPLYDYQRILIQNVFKTSVFNQYGARETGLIGTECQHGSIHLNILSHIIEVLPFTNNKDNNEGFGEILVTDLANYAMPFIRYKIGDVGELSSDVCLCGIGLPLLKSLDGRTTDVFTLPDGSLVPGVSLTGRVMGDNPRIKQLQIIQEEIARIRVNVIKAENFANQDFMSLKQNLRNYFPETVDIDFSFVAELEKEKSGKIRFCANRILRNKRDTA
jgi:phenylacetate-CoA ligase